MNRIKSEGSGANFHSFYRYFLLRLFHEGLGGRKRTPDLEELIGQIPYLNGGLFDIHELELEEHGGHGIHIPDEAFERIFDYFDRYQWYLDERPLKEDNEINPDVLGYIFEKYINQKQMGAYYTKDDITEYIGKYSIIPFIFETAQKSFGGGKRSDETDSIWNLIREDPDRYMYPAFRHGISWDYDPYHPELGNPLDTPHELPDDVARGVEPDSLHNLVGESPPSTLSLRNKWNLEAAAELGLTNETWREVIARRSRYEDIRSRIGDGELNNISELTTLNLDVRRFVQDAIEHCEEPGLLRAFWFGVSNVTVLDPTCGSGAFLFAALNILEPLYQSCLDRMSSFVEDSDRLDRIHDDIDDFREILENVSAHPNTEYFVMKNIILNNLFGVDIMEEAVEICKLRLFLKLAAQIEPNEAQDNFGVEPLPDIDFNIRAGKSLVGFLTLEASRATSGKKFDFDDAASRISDAAEDLEVAFDVFRAQQVEADGSTIGIHKSELRAQLNVLESELNQYLAGEYGVRPTDTVAYESWQRSHQPFHWFVEFPGIMLNGGFDVIIGNPPYVEYSRVRGIYTVDGYETKDTGNLYPFVIERSLDLLRSSGKCGMIVPISGFANNSMKSLQRLMRQFTPLHISSFHQRPAQLFDGVLQRLSIFFLNNEKSDESVIHTTSVNRWYADSRSELFQTLTFTTISQNDQDQILKVGSDVEAGIISKLFDHKPIATYLSPRKDLENIVAYRTAGGGYWWTFLTTQFDTKSLSNKFASFQDEHDSSIFMAALSSDLFWWYYFINFDLFNLKDYMIFSFRFDASRDSAVSQKLIKLGKLLEEELIANSVRYLIRSKTRGDSYTLKYQNAMSKPILDQIDQVLAEHYGFNEQELDFIMNYDLKYRIGRS